MKRNIEGAACPGKTHRVAGSDPSRIPPSGADAAKPVEADPCWPASMFSCDIAHAVSRGVSASPGCSERRPAGGCRSCWRRRPRRGRRDRRRSPVGHSASSADPSPRRRARASVARADRGAAAAVAGRPGIGCRHRSACRSRCRAGALQPADELHGRGPVLGPIDGHRQRDRGVDPGRAVAAASVGDPGSSAGPSWRQRFAGEPAASLRPLQSWAKGLGRRETPLVASHVHALAGVPVVAGDVPATVDYPAPGLDAEVSVPIARLRVSFVVEDFPTTFRSCCV